MRKATASTLAQAATRTAVRSYGGKGMRGEYGGKGGKGMDMGYGGKGGKGMPDMDPYGKGGKGMYDMDPYGKGMKGMDMGKGGKGMYDMDPYGKGGKGMPDMGMYGGKGGKGMDMDPYGKGMKGMDMGKGGKGMYDMDPYGKGGKGMPDMGKGGKGMYDMDPYGKGGKGMPDMGMYGGKGGKGMDMDPYGKGGMKGMDMGKGGKGMYDMDPYGKGGKGMEMDYGGKGMKGAAMAGAGMGMGMAAAQQVPVPSGPRVPPASLKLDYPYPAGQTPELGMFDVRDEVCRSLGFLHGQKIRVTNPSNADEMFEMVVVGAARDPESGEVGMWFHIAGEPGAGMFNTDMLEGYREFMHVVGKVDLHPLDANEQKELGEHAKLMHRMQMNEINTDCFNSWRMSKTLRKMWQPKDIPKTATWPPVYEFGYAMDTGDEEIGAVFAKFDKRQDVIGLFTVQDGIKLGHGVTITVPQKEGAAKDYVVIGCRPMPGVRYVLWAHSSDEAGARPISIRKLKKATLKNVPPQNVAEKEQSEFKESDPEHEVEELMAFEKFIARAERAVVRRVKPKKGKKGDKDGKSEKPEENKATQA